MKKNYTLCLCILIAAFSLMTACQSNEPELTDKASNQELSNSGNEIVVATEKEEYTPSDNEITLDIQNKNDTDFLYGKHFAIEKNVDGIWYKVPFKEGMDIFEDIGLWLKKKSTSTQTISLDRLENPLSPGNYRVVKSFGEIEESPSAEEEKTKTILAAPFEVRE